MNTFMTTHGRFKEKAIEAGIIFTFMVGAGIYSCITRELKQGSSNSGIEKIQTGSTTGADSTHNNVQYRRSND
jgi:hypothetical protein